jgi:hypothetical protein
METKESPNPRSERGFKVDEITHWEGGGGGEVRW